jgi:hypothetical protein
MYDPHTRQQLASGSAVARLAKFSSFFFAAQG